MIFSKKVAVEGFPMVPNPHFLLGHLPLMQESDFDQCQRMFVQEHADTNGRCCFWIGGIPALSVTLPEDVENVLKRSSHFP